MCNNNTYKQCIIIAVQTATYLFIFSVEIQRKSLLIPTEKIGIDYTVKKENLDIFY